MAHGQFLEADASVNFRHIFEFVALKQQYLQMRQLEKYFFLQGLYHVFAEIQMLQLGQSPQKRRHNCQLRFSDFEGFEIEALTQALRNGASFVDGKFLKLAAEDLSRQLLHVYVADLSYFPVAEGSNTAKGNPISSEILVKDL